MKINSLLCDTLRQHITGDTLREYWTKKKKVVEHENHIDWGLRNRSIRNISKSQQRWLCKHTTGFCGVGRMLLRYKWQTHSNCPRCNQDNETTHHVLQCKGQQAQEIWDTQIKELDSWMKDNAIQHDISKIITACTTAWVKNTQ